MRIASEGAHAETGRRLSPTAVVSIVVGLVLLIGAPVGWKLSQPPTTVGEVPVATAPDDLEGPSGIDDGEGLVAAREPAAVASDDRASPDGPAAPPTNLGIPAIGVDAEVLPVGLTHGGAMEIPADAKTIGWYEPGALPGEAGTAVVAAHVDHHLQGRGAFWHLDRLEVDHLVTVTHDDGATSEWRVTGRTTYPKDQLPLGELFTRSGPTRLVLITCGGAFDSRTGHYEENVVVYTEPAAP